MFSPIVNRIKIKFAVYSAWIVGRDWEGGGGGRRRGRVKVFAAYRTSIVFYIHCDPGLEVFHGEKKSLN